MDIDVKNQLRDNLLHQWNDLSFSEKRNAVEESVCTLTFFGTLANSARCAGKRNWPAAFYNLVLAGGCLALLINQ